MQAPRLHPRSGHLGNGLGRRLGAACLHLSLQPLSAHFARMIGVELSPKLGRHVLGLFQRHFLQCAACLLCVAHSRRDGHLGHLALGAHFVQLAVEGFGELVRFAAVGAHLFNFAHRRLERGIALRQPLRQRLSSGVCRLERGLALRQPLLQRLDSGVCRLERGLALRQPLVKRYARNCER